MREMGTKKPNPATHPNLYAWAAIVSKFKDTVQAKWGAGELPRPAAAAVEEKKPAAKPAKAAAPAEEEIDEDDLFGDDPDAEAAAAELAAKKKAEAPKKKKAAPIAKSIVLLEVKPLDDETNLDELAS